MKKFPRNLRTSLFFPSILYFFLSMLVVIAGCGRQDTQTSSNAEEKSAEGSAVSVRTVPAENRSIAETITDLGTCEALLDKTATIAPAIEGQVVDILVRQGDAVKAGQPLVQLDTKLAEANLREKNTNRDGLKESLRLLQSRPRTEEQKGYQLVIDEAQLAVQKAEAVVNKLRPLKEKGEISEQQMFETELSLKQAQLAQRKAENQLEVLLLGPRAEAIDEANAHIAAAEAGVVTAQLQRDLLTLRSPIEGVADRIGCKLGQTLAIGASIGEVVDTKQLIVLIWLPAFDAANIRVEQCVEVNSGDSPQRKNERSELKAICGKVISIGRVVDNQTGSLPIRVLIDNPQSRFALGQTVTATITIRNKNEVLAVPIEAVDDLGKGPQFSVVRDAKTVVLHPHLGMRNKYWVEVEDTDLKPGEPVIVEGGYNLPEGTEVSVQKASPGDERKKDEPPAGDETTP